MPWIRVISPEEAEGVLAEEYEAAVRRAGRVWNIVSLMSQNPRTMRASMGVYLAVMHGPSPLSRARREMLAVVVSAANHCHYWIRAHAHDLRAEVARGFGIADAAAADRLVAAVARDWRTADLGAADRALCAFAEKLTREPAASTAADVAALRGHGFDDAAIHDAVQVVSYFNYINRVADGLGVDPEPGIRAWDEEGGPG